MPRKGLWFLKEQWVIKFWLLIRTLMDYLFKSSLSLGGATSGTDNVCLPRLYPLGKEAVKTKELSPPPKSRGLRSALHKPSGHPFMLSPSLQCPTGWPAAWHCSPGKWEREMSPGLLSCGCPGLPLTVLRAVKQRCPSNLLNLLLLLVSPLQWDVSTHQRQSTGREEILERAKDITQLVVILCIVRIWLQGMHNLLKIVFLGTGEMGQWQSQDILLSARLVN